MTLWTVQISFEWDDHDRDAPTVFRAWTRIRAKILRTMRRLGLRWLSTSWIPRH